jgi:hypothetical protein
MGQFNPDLLPDAFACCPLCHSKGSLSIKAAGNGDKFLSCSACEAMWLDLKESGMRLVSGPAEHLGHKNLAGWAAPTGAPLDLGVMEEVAISPTPRGQALTARGVAAVLLILVIVTVPGVLFWRACSTITEPLAVETSIPPIRSTLNEQAYVRTIVAQTNRVGPAMQEIGALASSPQLSNMAWKVKLISDMEIIRAVYGEASAMPVPTSMTAIHGYYLQGLAHYNAAMTYITTGLDSNSPSLISSAAAEMTAGTDDINRATALIQQWNSQR